SDRVLVGSSVAVRGVVFVFPGQGSQWLGMARGLVGESPVFVDALGECDRVLQPLLGWSVVEVLETGDEVVLGRVDVVQPVLFAMMVSLAAVWRSLGVEPDAVVGHSQGEIAAAYVAGALSLADAALVVARRSQLLVDIATQGGMLAVPMSRQDVEASVAAWHGALAIAAVNGPRSTVVSGPIDLLDEYFEFLESDGVRVRRIPVDYAAHSAQVELFEERLGHELRSVAPRSGDVPLWSTVTGGWLDTSEMDGGYWYRNLREPVEFEDAISGLSAGHGVFVEVSAHPVVTVGMEETIEAAGGSAVIVSTLRRDRGELAEVLCSAGELFVAGVDVSWEVVFAGRGARRVGLPTYAFERKRFWLHSQVAPGDAGALGVGTAGHPLLGAVVELPAGGVIVTGRLSLRGYPWLADHQVAGVVLLPGTGFVELLVAAGDYVGAVVIEELTVVRPLVLSDDAVQVRVGVGKPDADGRCEASVYSRPGTGDAVIGEWVLHASAVLDTETADTASGLGSWPPVDAEEIDVVDVYGRVSAHGYGYGPAFQGLRRMWQRGEELFAEVALP
ncbi:acyltransferase domain-containing protein, partial [Nocardia sp. NPDC046473]|uniref:acyltransferase domain-containing protein n=1 Tax=Nocardia sp. NPDC046473 TaxID=3155733 RepID=UPI0034003587